MGLPKCVAAFVFSCPIVLCYFIYRCYEKTWCLYLTPRGIRCTQPHSLLLPCLDNQMYFILVENVVGRVRVLSGTAATLEVRMKLMEEKSWCPCTPGSNCNFCSTPPRDFIVSTEVCTVGPIYNIDEFMAAVNRELDKRDQMEGGAITTAM